MHRRFEIEECHTIEEMKAIIDSFAEDHIEYSNAEVLYRTGVAKDIAEEYIPLFGLAMNLSNCIAARLSQKSNPGPDAVLYFSDGAEKTVQIVCADENHSRALKRQKLSKGEVIFANMTFFKNKTGEIESCGRALTTRAWETKSFIKEVIAAIHKKTQNYHTGTQILLISVSRSEKTFIQGWQQQLLASVSEVADIPYEQVYVITANSCVECKGNVS
jgi:hypothetical protein